MTLKVVKNKREDAVKPTTKPPAVKKYCQILLERALNENPAVIFAAVSTVDGISFAFASAREDIAASRIAAMTSSLLSLSESLSKEAVKGECAYNAISTDFGSIVTVRVPTPEKLHTLSLCADSSDNMAMVMRLSFDTAEKLAQIIEYPK